MAVFDYEVLDPDHFVVFLRQAELLGCCFDFGVVGKVILSGSVSFIVVAKSEKWSVSYPLYLLFSEIFHPTSTIRILDCPSLS